MIFEILPQALTFEGHLDVLCIHKTHIGGQNSQLRESNGIFFQIKEILFVINVRITF